MRVCVSCGRTILNTTTWTNPTYTSSTRAVQQRHNSVSSSCTIPANLTYCMSRVIYIRIPCSPFSTCDTHGISGQQHPEGEPRTNITMYLIEFFGTLAFFSLPPASLFPCSRQRGTQEASVNTAVQVRALAEVRGTCSGGSKSRKLASNHRTRFRPPRASQVPCKTRTTVFSSA